MRLSRFFGGGKADQPQEPNRPEADATTEEVTPEPGDEEYEGVPEGDPNVDQDVQWRDRAADVIPGGASTGSKRPAALYGEEATAGPTHYTRASGCVITTAGGRTLIDCSMALGSVAIGYADDAITRSVLQAAAMGNVSGLSHASEIDVAERLCDIIPCAEQVRFLKTGAEAVSAAVRIARTYTGRNRIVASGYFGWHDWANEDAGIPAGARADVTRVPFDDVATLEDRKSTRLNSSHGYTSYAVLCLEKKKEANPLGCPGEGFKIAMSARAQGRFTVADGDTGLLRACRAARVTYGRQRKAFGVETGPH